AASPEAFPFFQGRFAARLDYAPDHKVVPSCIHCHQVGEAQRHFYRDQGKPIPERLLFPYPNPRVLGLAMDPQQRARGLRATPWSAAGGDGFRAGDELTALAGQPMLSCADIQWVLHHADDTGELPAAIRRDGAAMALRLSLPPHWRQQDDIGWRATSWDLRRM